MKPIVILVALAGALIAAGIWAVITILTGYEAGIVAWAVGGLIGGAMFAAGGRGVASGGTAVACTLFAILAGKAIALDPAIANALEELFTEDMYAELMADAEEYPGAEDDDALSSFIVDHSYGESGSEEEIEMFLATWGPLLERWKAEKPSFEEWQAGEVARFRAENMAGESWFDRYLACFGLFDLIFIGLGITSAFKLAGRPEDVTSMKPMKSAKSAGSDAPPPSMS